MKKSLLVISWLIGSMLLIGCGSDDSSTNKNNDNNSTSSQTTGENGSSSNGSAENSGESLSKLHIDDASDLYGYTLKAGNDNKATFIYTISCSGDFTFRWMIDGRVATVFNATGDTINTDTYGIDFIQIDNDGEEDEIGFGFKNDNQDLVIGKSNYDGFTEVFITSIVKNSSCN